MSERKYTDDEIVKALECFSIGVGCKGCPFVDQGCFDCGNIPTEFSESVLALVNRQKAEIETLQEVNADLNESLRLAAEANKDLKAEIERLTIELGAMRGAANSYKMRYEDAKSEVDNLIYKLECLLCHATGGRLSKHTYGLSTMESVVTDYINETYNDGRAEAIKEFAERLKEKSGCIVARRDGVELYTTKLYQIRATDIDNLVAEMTEGE